MPHMMCVPCRTRCQSAAGRGDLIDDLCPDCGAPWEPAGELSSVLGFRLITVRHPGAAASDEALWLDDGEQAIAVALPRPRT
jgi:Zn-finger nucleic acid-binding protein